MKAIEDKITKDGHVIGNDILKVDSFLNHQIDTNFAIEVGKYFASSFGEFTKVLTIETSGVAYALTTAMYKNNVPIVFARKNKSKIIDSETCYSAKVKSFTKGIVSDVIVDKRYISKEDKVLIVDDFLAEGNAALGLIDIARQSGASIVGVAAVINKVFQGGEKAIQDQGIKVVSGARIKDFVNGKVIFYE